MRGHGRDVGGGIIDIAQPRSLALIRSRRGCSGKVLSVQAGLHLVFRIRSDGRGEESGVLVSSESKPSPSGWQSNGCVSMQQTRGSISEGTAVLTRAHRDSVISSHAQPSRYPTALRSCDPHPPSPSPDWKCLPAVSTGRRHPSRRPSSRADEGLRGQRQSLAVVIRMSHTEGDGEVGYVPYAPHAQAQLGAGEEQV